MSLLRRHVLGGPALALGLALIATGLPGNARADLVGVIATAKPALVAVGTLDPTASPRFGFRGSGFAVADGTLIATSAHVLPGPEDVEALAKLAVLAARDGQLRELRRARVVAFDRTHDVALLRIDGAPLPTMPVAPADAPAREGQAVALMGFPIGGVLGFSPVTHRGIVSAITRAALPAPTSRQLDPAAVARLREGADFEVLQLDATAYPGNSGGPLLDAASGRVLGLVTMVLIKNTRESALSQPTGITYAVPVRHLQALLDRAPAQTPQTR